MLKDMHAGDPRTLAVPHAECTSEIQMMLYHVLQNIHIGGANRLAVPYAESMHEQGTDSVPARHAESVK